MKTANFIIISCLLLTQEAVHLLVHFKFLRVSMSSFIALYSGFSSDPYTLKTGIPVEDSILRLLRRVSCSEIQIGVGFHSELETVFQTYMYVLTEVMKLASSFILNFLECNL